MARPRVSLAALAVLALGLSAARSLLFVALGGQASPRSASVAVRAEKKPAEEAEKKPAAPAAEKKPAAPAAEKKPAAAKPKPKPKPAAAKKAQNKVWNPAMKTFEDTGSAYVNPTKEGMSHPNGLYFAEIKPEKPKKGYYYNRAWKKVEVDGPNDPTTAGLPGWSIEANAEGKLRFDQERTYGWRVGPGEDNVSVRPVR